MAVSGSRNWIVTRDNIIAAALRKLKGQGAVHDMSEYADAAFALNSLVQSWHNDGVMLWTVSEDYIQLVDGTISYSLDASVVEIQTPYFRRDRSDTSLTILTREEYMALPDKYSDGDPNQIYVDFQLANPTAYTYPRPNYSTGIVVGTDANNYVCILDHTSASASRPITGADYATYWLATSKTGAVWVTATAYHSDALYYTKVLRLQDFDATTDNPDFPVRWTQALIWGLASDLSHDYGMPDPEKKKLFDRAKIEFNRALHKGYDNTSLFISPSLR